MEEEKDIIILTKYIIGEANDEEKKFIDQWLSEDSSNEDLYIEMKALWNASDFYENSHSINVEKAYQLFRQRISKPKRSVFILQLNKFKVAAFIALLISIGALTFFIIGKKKNDKPSFSEEIIVPNGHQKKIILNDGTTVWLNAASTLKIDNAYGKKNRNVYLEGEGYFQVVHDKKMVFTITTKDYTVRDIGTEFNIKAYPTDSIFETAVMDGKISVEGRFADNGKVSTIFLSKNGVLKIQHPSRNKIIPAARPAPVVVLKNAPNINTYNYWMDDMLVFDDLSFKDIAVQLERKYGVVILIKDDSLNNYHFSGSFNKVPDIEHVLNIIQETTPISYQLNGDTVSIKIKEKK